MKLLPVVITTWLLVVPTTLGYLPLSVPQKRKTSATLQMARNHDNNVIEKGLHALTAFGLGLALASTTFFGSTSAFADTANYDGFAEYAKDNQMEQSDVGCFVNKCGDQTKDLFSNPRGIKGVSCLGRCKGEQACATRCFAQFGSETDNPTVRQGSE